MKVSVVIPTYNRPEDLDETLSSLGSQTRTPGEVLVVDTSQTDASRNVVREQADTGRFPVKYLYNEKGNNLTTSRNVGVSAARGDLVVFLDDDVLLERDYLESLVGFMEERPEAKGAQGYQKGGSTEGVRRRLRRLIARVFCLSRSEPGECRILPNGQKTYPVDPSEPIQCQWLSGCNMAYRREVFSKEQFDETLKRGSFGEDWDFSLRVATRWPESLFLVPEARLVHKGSPTSRAPTPQLTLLREAYSTYLMHKNFESSIRTRALRAYSRLGEFLLHAGEVVLSRNGDVDQRLKYLGYWLQAVARCWYHRGELAEGRFDLLSGELSY